MANDSNAGPGQDVSTARPSPVTEAVTRRALLSGAGAGAAGLLAGIEAARPEVAAAGTLTGPNTFNGPNTLNGGTGAGAGHFRNGATMVDATGSAALFTGPAYFGWGGGSVTFLDEAAFKSGRPWYDVRAFGAVGDGVADDTAALRAALARAGSGGSGSTGGVVFVPPGVYKYTAQLQIPSNTTLQGCGAASKLVPYMAGGNSNNIMTNVGSIGAAGGNGNGDSNIALESLWIDRSNATSKHGIRFTGVDNLRVRGVICTEETFTPSGTGAMSISAFANGIAYPNLTSTNVLVTECIFRDTNSYGLQLGQVTNAVIANNVFTNTYREVIGVEPDGGTGSSAASRVVIAGNVIECGNHLQGADPDGAIIVTAITTTGSGNFYTGVRDVRISGNLVTFVDGASGGAPAGILVIGADSVSVSGNTVRNSPGSGILIGNSTDPTVAPQVTCSEVVHNLVINDGSAGTAPTRCGIRVRNTQRSFVSANRIIGTGYTIGLWEDGDPYSVANAFVGNDLRFVVPAAGGAKKLLSAGAVDTGNLL